MTARFSNLAVAAGLSLLFILPFAVLELRNRPFNQDFPIPLFVVLFLLPLTFFLLLISIARNASGASRINVVLRVAAMAIIAFLWVGLVRDQMPCFLGVPNCD